MYNRVNDVTSLCMNRLKLCGAALMLFGVVACGSDGSSSSGSNPGPLVITNVNSGAPIGLDASVSSGTEIALTGVDLAAATVEFVAESNDPQPLLPDLSIPGQFWLPEVSARTGGFVRVSIAGGPTYTLAIRLVPFETSARGGETVRSFLQASLSSTDARLSSLPSNTPVDLVSALQAARNMIQQGLTWVTGAMQQGDLQIAQLVDGTPVTLTPAILRALDQRVLYWASLAATGGNTAQLTPASPIQKFFDFLIPNAFAQSSLCVTCLATVPASDAALADLTKALRQCVNHAISNGVNMAGIGSASLDNATSANIDPAMLLSEVSTNAACYATIAAAEQQIGAAGRVGKLSAAQQATLAELIDIINNRLKVSDRDRFASNEGTQMVNGVTDTQAAGSNIIAADAEISSTLSDGGTLCPDGSTPTAGSVFDVVCTQ